MMNVIMLNVVILDVVVPKAYSIGPDDETKKFLNSAKIENEPTGAKVLEKSTFLTVKIRQGTFTEEESSVRLTPIKIGCFVIKKKIVSV